jgi:hypothetical protein
VAIRTTPIFTVQLTTMRKTLLLFHVILFAFPMTMIGQGISIAFGDSLVQGHVSNTKDIEAYIEVRNDGAADVEIKVTRRLDRTNALLDSNAICWVVCFGTDTDTSSTQITLAPGQRSAPTDFTGHVYPDRDGMAFSGGITYIFYDKNNPTDSAAHTVYYEVIPDMSTPEENASTWSVYPNPASDFIWIEAFDGAAEDTRIEFTDVLGRILHSERFDASFGSTSISLDALRSGVYLYGIYEGDRLIEKKKLVVRK